MFLAALVVSLLGGLLMMVWVREPRHIQPVALATETATEAKDTLSLAQSDKQPAMCKSRSLME